MDKSQTETETETFAWSQNIMYIASHGYVVDSNRNIREIESIGKANMTPIANCVT